MNTMKVPSERITLESGRHVACAEQDKDPVCPFTTVEE